MKFTRVYGTLVPKVLFIYVSEKVKISLVALWTTSSFSLIIAKKCLRLPRLFSLSMWTTWILHGWWWRSSCKTLLMVRFDNLSCSLWRLADRRGLLQIVSLIRVFWILNFSFNSTSFFVHCSTFFTHSFIA